MYNTLTNGNTPIHTHAHIDQQCLHKSETKYLKAWTQMFITINYYLHTIKTLSTTKKNLKLKD